MLNKVQLIGRLGQDPEIRSLQSGDQMANLSIATSKYWTDKKSGERKEATEWHRVTIFGRLAEVAGEVLEKGNLVWIEGSLKTRKYEDRDGNDRYITEIHAYSMLKLTPKGDGGETGKGGGDTRRRSEPARNAQENLDDDIPF